MNSETSTHLIIWKKRVAVATGIVTLIGLIVPVPYLIGQMSMESQIVELKAENKHLQSELNRSKEEYERSREAIDAKDRQIDRLSRDVGNSSTCLFIQKRIREIEEKIAKRLQSPFLGESDIPGSPDYKKPPKQRDELENQLAEYKKLLGTCNR